jgi:hypothetical protein
MRSNRKNNEGSGAGWLYADVLLGLLLIFLAAADRNKPLDLFDSDAIAPECSADVNRKPIKMTLDWRTNSTAEALIEDIESELEKNGVKESTRVGLILAYGGSQGSDDESAKNRSIRVIEELKANWNRFGRAYYDTDGAFDRSLNGSQVKLKLFMERDCP